MRPPRLAFIFFLSSLSFANLSAQDPGVREYEARRESSGGISSSADAVAKSAAVINSMDVLDDTQPIESGDVISMRIVEDRR